MERKLTMGFDTKGAKTYNVVVANAKEDLTETQVKTAMEGVIAKNIFMTTSGELAAIKNAKIVETTTIDLDVTK